MALSGCWKKLWPETADDLQGFLNQKHEIKNILVLNCEVTGEGFKIWKKLIFKKFSALIESTDKGLEQVTALSELEGEEDYDIVNIMLFLLRHLFLLPPWT